MFFIKRGSPKGIFRSNIIAQKENRKKFFLLKLRESRGKNLQQVSFSNV